MVGLIKKRTDRFDAKKFVLVVPVRCRCLASKWTLSMPPKDHARRMEGPALDQAAGERDEGRLCAVADHDSGDWGEWVILFPKLNALYQCPKAIGWDEAVSLGGNPPLAMQPARASNCAVMQSCLASLGSLVVVAHLFLADTSALEPSPGWSYPRCGCSGSSRARTSRTLRNRFPWSAHHPFASRRPQVPPSLVRHPWLIPTYSGHAVTPKHQLVASNWH